MTAKKVFVDFVVLMEHPSQGNPFYIVKSANGNHYVSGLGGKQATGAPIGQKLKLYRASSAQMSALILERV